MKSKAITKLLDSLSYSLSVSRINNMMWLSACVVVQKLTIAIWLSLKVNVRRGDHDIDTPERVSLVHANYSERISGKRTWID